MVGAACQQPAEPDNAANGETTTTASVATTPQATTTLVPVTSTSPNTTSATGSTPTATTMIPGGVGPFPAVVLVHGGGWLVGDPTSLEPLATFLTENGYLTVNTTYQLSLRAPGFPTAFEDVACAVRHARSHPRSDGTVTLIGHSAGAHIASIVALTGSAYTGDCELTAGGTPDAFIGLAGPYDVLRVGPIMTAFFGSRAIDSPDDWDLGNPTLHVADNLSLRSLIIHGDIDQVIPPDFSDDFYRNLIDAGSDAELVILEGVDHAGARNPSIVGDIILDWLQS